MVGFRKITIQEGAVLLNGRPLKFFGVNRHDSDPRTGYAIDREQALKDLLEMKAMNINAIRPVIIRTRLGFHNSVLGLGFIWWRKQTWNVTALP